MKHKVKLLIESNGKLLLLKPLYKQKYTLIGGTVKKKETPLSAVIREGFEEAGLSLFPSDFTTYFNTTTRIKEEPVQFYCYLLRKDDLVFELKEHHKFQSLDWISINDGLAQLKGIEKLSAEFFNTTIFQKEGAKTAPKQAI